MLGDDEQRVLRRWVAGVTTPATPSASFSSPDITLPASTTNPVTVAVAASNVPPGTPVTVTAVGLVGPTSSASASLTGTLVASTASVSLTIPTNEPSVISASATFILFANNEGRVFAEGEEVRQVRVLARYGGVSRASFITKSGREIEVLSAR